jgi:hypothetical protein
MSERYTTFRDFYAFYLREHADTICRRLHVIGSSLVVIVLIAAVATQHWLWLIALPIIGYGFAWIGHFFFEHNRPATFTHPLYSLAGDWVMWWQVITGRMKF